MLEIGASADDEYGEYEKLGKIKRKKFTERAERIQNTISLLKSLACVLALIAAVFIYKSTENPIRRNNNIPCYVVGWG